MVNTKYIALFLILLFGLKTSLAGNFELFFGDSFQVEHPFCHHQKEATTDHKQLKASPTGLLANVAVNCHETFLLPLLLKPWSEITFNSSFHVYHSNLNANICLDNPLPPPKRGL